MKPKKFKFRSDSIAAAADDLLEACRAGARYSNALQSLQDQGLPGGSMVESNTANNLDDLFMDWHDKTHAAIDKAEGKA